MKIDFFKLNLHRMFLSTTWFYCQLTRADTISSSYWSLQNATIFRDISYTEALVPHRSVFVVPFFYKRPLSCHSVVFKLFEMALAWKLLKTFLKNINLSSPRQRFKLQPSELQHRHHMNYFSTPSCIFHPLPPSYAWPIAT